MKTVSIQTLNRLPLYLDFLKTMDRNGNVSAKFVADALKLGEIQVRKDLAAVSDRGRPKIGYVVGELISDLETFLGYNDVNDAVLVGAGMLGAALLSYDGFAEYGLNIVAGFDKDIEKCGTEIGGKLIIPAEKLGDFCTRMKIRIGIITVPASEAQAVCDELVAGGVLAVWNFAPTHLNAPDNILIKTENMASSLAVLSKHLEQKLHD